MSKLILFNKPFGVLSQFSDADNRETLASYIKQKNVYPAGRLDKDSEGLLLLTDDGKLQHKIAHPQQKMSKTYWVLIEGIPSEKSLQSLRDGIELKDGMTLPAKVKVISEPYLLWERIPPVRYRKNIPETWLEITIKEGRNRQVRRMTAAIDCPTLRLIRYRIGSWTIDGLENGQYREIKV
ncbi:MAG TPA: pseudouridine synthase [Leucothrix mucor]|nr:pseudouridine synthase [Leucothrix mucor]